MIWFTAGVIINCIAIAAAIANGVYDAMTLKYGQGHNAWVNLIALALGVVVILAYSLKNSGKLFAARVLLWIPAAPLLLMFIFMGLYIAIVMITKPNWR